MKNTSFLFSVVPNSQAGFDSPCQTTALNPAPRSCLISNSNIAELVSLVTSQQWVSPFLSESNLNIHTGLPAQPSNSNFSATIKMDDSDDNVFVTALTNINLKAAKNKEKNTSNEEIATSQQ